MGSYFKVRQMFLLGSSCVSTSIVSLFSLFWVLFEHACVWCIAGKAILCNALTVLSNPSQIVLQEHVCAQSVTVVLKAVSMHQGSYG